MRLQRICNHPGLIEPRVPDSSYVAGPLQYQSASLVLEALERGVWKVSGGFRKPSPVQSLPGTQQIKAHARLHMLASSPCPLSARSSLATASLTSVSAFAHPDLLHKRDVSFGLLFLQYRGLGPRGLHH